MNTSPFFLAVRAISAEFAHRIYFPIVVVVGIAVVVLLGISVFLVTIDAWWWLLLAPVLLLSTLAVFSAVVAGLIIKFLRPKQTRAQRKDVRTFVDSLQKTSEAVRTPKVLLFSRLLKDMLLPSQNNLINELSSEIGALRPRLTAIVNSFR